MHELKELNDSDNILKNPKEGYFDCVLSFGAEKKKKNGDFPEEKNREDIIKDTNGYIYGRSETFINSFKKRFNLEVLESARKIYSDKEYLGSWIFCICKQEKEDKDGDDLLCEDCDCPSESMKKLEGSIYLTHVRTHTDTHLSESESDNQEEENKHSNDNAVGTNINKVVLIDIIFMDVPRNYISNLLAIAQHRQLFLLNKSNDKPSERESLISLLEKFRLNIVTAPKSIVSGCSIKPLSKIEMMNILSHESEVISIEYTMDYKDALEACKENLSNFAENNIVMSDCSIIQQFYHRHPHERVLEKIQDTGTDLKKRFNNLVLTIFITNTIMSKITQLRLIDNAMREYFIKDRDKTSKDYLVDINFHIVNLSFLWYEDTFIYPTTEAMAQKIHSRFKLDDYKQELSQLQQIFENYMNTYITQQDEVSDKRKQLVLMIITVLSGISVVLSVQMFLFEFTTIFQRLIGFFSGVVLIVFVVFMSYFLIKRKKNL